MSEPRPWVPHALSYLVGITLLLLAVQYILGIWTSAYAPAQFTTTPSTAAYTSHIVAGYIVGLAALVLFVVSVLSKDPRVMAQSLAVLVTIGLAGVFGRLFVSTTPNDPAYSFAMGLLFLVAFGACMGLLWSVWRSPAERPMGSPSNPPAGPAA